MTSREATTRRPPPVDLSVPVGADKEGYAVIAFLVALCAVVGAIAW